MSEKELRDLVKLYQDENAVLKREIDVLENMIDSQEITHKNEKAFILSQTKRQRIEVENQNYNLIKTIENLELTILELKGRLEKSNRKQEEINTDLSINNFNDFLMSSSRRDQPFNQSQFTESFKNSTGRYSRKKENDRLNDTERLLRSQEVQLLKTGLMANALQLSYLNDELEVINHSHISSKKRIIKRSNKKKQNS